MSHVLIIKKIPQSKVGAMKTKYTKLGATDIAEKQAADGTTTLTITMPDP